MAVTQLYVMDGPAAPGTTDYVARDDRLIWTALLPPGTGPLGRASGVRQTNDFAFSWVAGRQATIGVGAVAIPGTDRHYMVVNDAPFTVNFDMADAQARIDSVYVRAFDSEAGWTPAGGATIAVAKGVASGTPAAPTLPGGAFRLWNVRYEANAATGTQTDQRVFSTTAARQALQTTSFGWNMGTNNPPSSSWTNFVNMQTLTLEAGNWFAMSKGFMNIALSASVAWRLSLIMDSPFVELGFIEAAGMQGIMRVPWMVAGITGPVAAGRPLRIRLARNGSTAGTQLVSEGQLFAIPV